MYSTIALNQCFAGFRIKYLPFHWQFLQKNSLKKNNFDILSLIPRERYFFNVPVSPQLTHLENSGLYCLNILKSIDN